MQQKTTRWNDLDVCLFVRWNQSAGKERIIPTQLPTQGQWWSNLAMQRLHTAQCLDLMGFRICGGHKKQRNVAAPLLTSSVYVRFSAVFTKQVLQNMLRSRLPVSASSTIVWNETQKKDLGKTRRISLWVVWQRNKRSTDDVQAGWDYPAERSHWRPERFTEPKQKLPWNVVSLNPFVLSLEKINYLIWSATYFCCLRFA